MSELPTIDPLKVAQRNAQKLRASLAEAENRETQLEVLAEALRDERDERDGRIAALTRQLTDLQQTQAVPDITTLPEGK